MFSFLVNEPFKPAFEHGASQLTNLTHFSMLAGLMLYCACSDFFPALIGFLVGLVLVLLWVCRYFSVEYYRMREEIKSINLDVQQAEMFAAQLEVCEMKNAMLKKVLRNINKAMECPILMEVPEDPVLAPSGYVYSDKALSMCPVRYGKHVCPMTRVLLSPEYIQHCYPVNTVCEELRMVAGKFE